MLIKSKYLLFIPSLILGTFISISSSSWFSAWIGLEINLMSFAPILINRFSIQSIETSIKYFIIQALASTILLFFIFLTFKQNTLNMSHLMEFSLTMTLLLKAGVAPLHFWFPQVMVYSEWFQCMIILTWQKLAPFILLSFLHNSLLMLAIYISAIVGTMGAINQTNLKKIMTYSSINHSAWMMMIIYTNNMTWILYFSSYIFMNISVIYIFIIYNIENISTSQMIKTSPLIKMISMVNFLSLAGLPPFLGFTVKLLAISIFIKSNFNMFMMTTLLTSSFLALYFYLRMLYSSMFFNFSGYMTLNTLFIHKMFINLYCVISLISVLVMPALVLLT